MVRTQITLPLNVCEHTPPLTLVSCVVDDLPRMGVMDEARASSPFMGNMELDQVDSRGRRWRRFCISGQDYHVNMSVLEPYLQVLSHGGESKMDTLK